MHYCSIICLLPVVDRATEVRHPCHCAGPRTERRQPFCFWQDTGKWRGWHSLTGSCIVRVPPQKTFCVYSLIRTSNSPFRLSLCVSKLHYKMCSKERKYLKICLAGGNDHSVFTETNNPMQTMQDTLEASVAHIVRLRAVSNVVQISD